MIPFPEGIQPDIFTINLGGFKFTLYWYALAYVVGIIAWWKIAAVALKKNYLWPENVTPLNPAKLEDLVTYLVLGIICLKIRAQKLQKVQFAVSLAPWPG